MPVSPYFNLHGTTREALAFYADVFGGKVGMTISYGGMDDGNSMNLSSEELDLVAHADLLIDGTLIHFSDTPPSWPFEMGNASTLLYESASEAQLRSVFDRLAEGGQVQMPLQKTSWTELYGYVRDKFGIGWQLNLDDPASRQA